jgi:hypothetical protein
LTSDAAGSPVTFVGHPFVSIGKGEELRANARALDNLDEPIAFYDVYRAAARTDPDHVKLVGSREIRLGAGKRIFHVNGDEVEPVLQRLAATGSSFSGGYNIVVPAWELPLYPKVWASSLQRFDEVWAISNFVKEGLAAVGVDSNYIGQSVEIPFGPFLSRRYFGIRESAFVFLAFTDFSSFSARKNPRGAVEMFKQLIARRPFDDLQLVVKVKGDDNAAREFLQDIGLEGEHVVVIDRLLDTFEQHSLINACDCLTSLHRSEGFGRGPAEAMYCGRLALATGWSGNMDFMSDANSLLIRSELVPVQAGEYPQYEGQHWAEPDIGHAVDLAVSVVDRPGDALRRASQGRRDIQRLMGNRAVALRMLDRLLQ